MQKSESRLMLVIIALALAMIAAWFFSLGNQPLRPTVFSSKALIGGEFALTDQHGKSFTSSELEGHYSLVFFGFSRCPAVCPVGLSTMTNALDLLPKDQSDQVLPVFITVDPEHDTPEKLAEFAGNFHPRLVALTGSREQVKQAEDAYKVFASKVPLDEAAPKGEYTMNHSSYIFLMGKNGEYLKHFGHDSSPADLAETLRGFIGK